MRNLTGIAFLDNLTQNSNLFCAQEPISVRIRVKNHFEKCLLCLRESTDNVIVFRRQQSFVKTADGKISVPYGFIQPLKPLYHIAQQYLLSTIKKYIVPVQRVRMTNFGQIVLYSAIREMVLLFLLFTPENLLSGRLINIRLINRFSLIARKQSDGSRTISGIYTCCQSR